MQLPPWSFLAPRLGVLAALAAAVFFFAGSETAFFALGRARRERLEGGRIGERAVARLLAEPRRLVTTLLVGGELASVGLAALITALVARAVPGLAPAWVAVLAVAVALPIVAVVCQLVPRSIAVRAADRWTALAAWPLGLAAWLLTPVRLLAVALAGVGARLLGGASPSGPRPVGEDEFRTLVDVGSEAGELEASERRLIHRVFEFGDRTVAEIMTPARKVFSLSFDLPLARMRAEVARRGFSRVPVHHGRDEVVGVLHSKDLVGMPLGRLHGKTVKDLLHPALFVPKQTACDRLFREFQKKRTHLAIVVDEYGSLAGLVTMDDLLEELFGELRDERTPEDGAGIGVEDGAGPPAGGEGAG